MTRSDLFRFRPNLKEILDEDLFLMDATSGMLQTNATLGRFVDGYFHIVLKASNGVTDQKNGDFTTLKVITLGFEVL